LRGAKVCSTLKLGLLDLKILSELMISNPEVLQGRGSLERTEPQALEEHLQITVVGTSIQSIREIKSLPEVAKRTSLLTLSTKT
jgi:hypothetical protein